MNAHTAQLARFSGAEVDVMWRDVQFNTLLFLTEQRSANVRRSGARLQRLFVGQALSLARSLNICGKELRVFTNDRDTVLDLIARESPSGAIRLQVKQVDFPRSLPEDIGFFAAHHKLFLYPHFARDAHPNCLLDADVVINSNNLSLAQLFDQDGRIDGWVYDISDQVFPAYGTQALQQDIRLLGASHPFPRWYGGEFIMGTPSLFAYLHEHCSRNLTSYVALLSRLHNVGGEECFVSSALNHNAQGLTLADAGASGLVVRQWTNRTLHVGKPCKVLKQCLFWHLPDAKAALGRFHEHGSLRTLYRNVCWLAACRRVKTAATITRWSLHRTSKC